MIYLFSNYFTILFGTLFIFHKSLNQNYYTKVYVKQISCSIVATCIILFLHFLPKELIAITLVSLACIINKLVSQKNWKITVTVTIITSGISFALYTLSAILISTISILIIRRYIDSIALQILHVVFRGLFLILFSNILFKFKRLRRGFIFSNMNVSFIGALISILIFLCHTIVQNLVADTNEYESIMFIPILGIIACFITIMIWWRKSITKTYKDGLKAKELAALNCLITEKDQYIDELLKNNDKLSQIIHKDNKLIPAMALTVQQFISVTAERYPETEEKATMILEQFQTIMKERTGILFQYKKETKKLPKTKIDSIDMMLTYFLQKSNDNDIDFDVIVLGNIRYLIENYINEERLRTLIADLIENAIIAVKPCTNKRILFTIGVFNEFYKISIEDSGIPFEEEILCELGKKRLTTHQDDGGSGRGYMAIFDILTETQASIFYKPYHETEHTTFTKKITVRFDGKNNTNFR